VTENLRGWWCKDETWWTSSRTYHYWTQSEDVAIITGINTKQRAEKYISCNELCQNTYEHNISREYYQHNSSTKPSCF